MKHISATASVAFVERRKKRPGSCFGCFGVGFAERRKKRPGSCFGYFRDSALGPTTPLLD